MSICLAITDADWALTKDVFSVLGTVVSAAGVGLAFYVGIVGLSTWKRQLRGTTDHELAKRSLLELYKFRESIERARSPIMFASEMTLDPEDAEGLGFKEKNYLGKCAGYQNRFNAIQDARRPIHFTLLEAEALWDRTLKELFEPLFKKHNDFYRYVEFYLMAIDPREDEEYRKANRDVIKDKPKIIYDKFGDVGDEFRQEFNKGVSAVEQYLKSKIA